jgi:tRNA-binding EMAP/Myf-like protein
MVDIGDGKPIQVVCGAPNARAGMKGVFSPAGTFIPGKNMTLAIGTIRGVESRGMLLAADDMLGPPDGEGKGTARVEVLDAGDAPIGTMLKVEGIEAGNIPAEIDIDTFFSIPMEVKDNTVMVGGKALTLNGNPVRTKIVSSGGVH